MQEAWAKGYQQGYQIGTFQGTAINIVVANFADLETLARAKITAINDLERLQQVIVDLAISRTEEQMECVLLSLVA